MEQQQNRHDDRQGSRPVAILKKSDSSRRCAGSHGCEEQSDHAGDPADEMRHAGRHIRRHWKWPMPEDLTDKEDEKRTNPRQYSTADQQPAEDVDVHAHIPRTGLNWWLNSRSRCGSDFLTAFTAEPCLMLDFVSTMCAEHIYAFLPR